MRIIFLTLLLLCSNAIAADFGCGRDTDRNGTVDNFCPASFDDDDADGYSVAQGDCDDAQWQIFPGTPTGGTIAGCAPGEWRMCKVDGTGYTACTTAQFDPTQADNQLYSDRTSTSVLYVATTGSDSTGDGSFANPYKTINKFSNGFSTRVTPTDGLTIVMRGGKYSDTYTFSGTKMLELTETFATNGLAIIGYPGENVEIESGSTHVGPMFFFVQAGTVNKITVDNIEFDGLKTWEGPALYTLNAGIGYRFRRIYAHDFDGENSNNASIVKCFQQSAADVTHSQFENMCDTQSATCQQTNQGFIDVQNRETRILYNVTRNTDADDQTSSYCFRFKHGAGEGQAYSAVNPSYVEGNYFSGCRDGLGPRGAKVYTRNNLILPVKVGGGNVGNGIGLGPESNHPYMGPNYIERNTIKGGVVGFGLIPELLGNTDGTIAATACTGNQDPTPISFQRNIIVNEASTMNIDNGMIRIAPYGSDVMRAAWLPSKVQIDYNVYYQANGQTSNIFREYSDNNGDTTCSGRGNNGGAYNWTAWRALFSNAFDQNSFNKDPGLNAATYLPTDSDSLDKGYGYQWPLIGATATPTPTPTATPTATPTPTKGLSIVFSKKTT